MAKVFRLYTQGISTYKGWGDCPTFPYDSTNRDQIQDPNGNSAKQEITSIPSPFARIDLVKNAFKDVCKLGIDGTTIFHKMVSDSLDIGQIFFNINKLKNKVAIIEWNPKTMIAALSQSPFAGHQYLADSLNKYMISDAAIYNFGQMQNIYLLNYINGPQQLNIIGATSPATLFFSNANDQTYIKDIFFGNDRPFDSAYMPLNRRDFAYVEYLFALRQSIPTFATLFPEFDDYLEKTFPLLDSVQQNSIRNLDSTSMNAYLPIPVATQQNNNSVEVLGYNLGQKNATVIPGASDFTIVPDLNPGVQPMVLPVDEGNQYASLLYVADKWGTTNRAPYHDSANLPNRVLPFDGATFPYLTISDFLEDNLVWVPYTLNSANYYDAGLVLAKGSCLIPLKPLFFKYFSVDKLISGNMLQMSALAGGSIKVTLKIPIKGNGKIKSIDYSRIYYNNRAADIKSNSGGIVNFDFTGLVMPLVKFNNPQDAVYNVSTISGKSLNYTLSFLNNGNNVNGVSGPVCRNTGKHNFKAENYIVEKQNFDSIRISDGNNKTGVIIPKFATQQNLQDYEFAVDLGTSNTHIEYKLKSDSISQKLSFTKNDCIFSSFFVGTIDNDGNQLDLLTETELLEKDFIPYSLGKGDFKFPTRTILSAARNIDWGLDQKPFGLQNISFTYDKRVELKYNSYHYNIKWSKDADRPILEAYIRDILLIIRNKVLLNNGDLSKVKIMWFYPTSMAPFRLQTIQNLWDTHYRNYFGGNATYRMTEAFAPIEYFFRTEATATSLISVDIGGGTTDIAFAKDKKISHITSFRFAANSLFEDAFADSYFKNGIIDYYKEHFSNFLSDRNLTELLDVMDGNGNHYPANMASFLFGLKDNSIIIKEGINTSEIDFNRILQEDKDFKIVFVLFYTAIIYHIAQIVKSEQLDVPRHISFSGNGSKIMGIITSDNKLLEKYTKLIFEKLGCSYGDKKLEIRGLGRDSIPKEVTCKGGILGVEQDDLREKIIVFKGDNSACVKQNDTYDSVTDAYKQGVVSSVKDFFDFVFHTMNAAFKFDDNFNVDPESLKLAERVSKDDISTFLDKGIVQRLSESRPEDTIEETFFFYPIKGVLNALSNEIFQKLKGDN